MGRLGRGPAGAIPALRRRPPVSVADVRERARRAVPRILFDFIDGGAGDEITQQRNLDAFAEIRIAPHMAVAAPTPSLATTVLGQPVSMPVLLAPCGGLSLFHPDGGSGAARGAVAAGTLAAVSTLSGERLEQVPRDAGADRHWFQLYKLGGTAGAKVLVERAKDAGYRALVVTVDSPIVGHKERDVRNGGVKPGGVSISKVDLPTVLEMAPKVINRPGWLWRFLRAGLPLGHPNFVGLGPDGSTLDTETAMAAWKAEPLVWDDFAWIRRAWTGPLVVKGVMGAADARRCVEVGADAVLISNHGGRQVDGVPGTADVLPEVVDAVGGAVEVLLDSGVRRGIDVVRARALGARAVLIGRPYLYGLAMAGQGGVETVLELLRAELERALILLGCSDIEQLDRSYLAGPAGSAGAAGSPGVVSAATGPRAE